ncbi:hypothetical protein CDD82_6024 [Ophiocordyceps australis]|uniref:Carboxylic ester hydrolase n=1 Tax=Ophiocordyceps australis TaxID=1399860 RepID=A0A2C5YZ79_9HYPO|nr:hypothetical protein CDD82_6024 [Ophiocordyceps australis]
MLGTRLCIAAALLATVSARPALGQDEEPPIVDLEYAIHQARYNEDDDLYTFKNIRFGEPPLGQYRFQPSVPVQSVNRTVNDGSFGHMCMQSAPEWQLAVESKKRGLPPYVVRKILEGNRKQNEDCLFLDVVVPRVLFAPPNAAGRDAPGAKEGAKGEAKGAPVMVWIYGGAYVFGQKDDKTFNPAGLIARSFERDGRGIIYVALNYRLGMFGWLNVPGDDAIFPNVALQDQLLALEWVKKYIHLFGGDPDQVTVFGESAGGGSIMHHITGNGGNNNVPFQQALIQSPGWQTVLDLEANWARTLETASKIAKREIRNGAELASLSSNMLFKINNKVVAESRETTYTFGPSIDGGYVRDLPGVLLLKGQFSPNLGLMLGHNSNEGLIWTTESVDSPAGLRAKFDDVLPNIPPENIDFLLGHLYPMPPQANYDTDIDRALFLFSEAFFTCNTRYLATAFGNMTWNYRFQVPPGQHAQDVPYTFFRGKKRSVIPSVAEQMQFYFTNFAMYGTPNQREAPIWPAYDDEARIVTFGEDGLGFDIDDTKNERCDYWQTGEYRTIPDVAKK